MNTADYKIINNTYIKDIVPNPKDFVTIEIGDSKQTLFHPQFKLLRWNNEVNASFRLVNSETDWPRITHNNHKIKYVKNKIEAHFYEKAEGRYEFEVILKEKPTTNVIEMTIQTKDLDFFYQRPLWQDAGLPAPTAECNDTVCINTGGMRNAHRPENVVGSYAVYYKDCPPNFLGGKEYRSGKAFHIFRPEVIDAVGKKVWADLHINVVRGIMTITIPQHFLDTGKYPLVVDPEFGYHPADPSAFSTDTNDNTNSYMKAHSTPASSGSMTSMSIYGKINAGTPGFNPALYSDGT